MIKSRYLFVVCVALTILLTDCTTSQIPFATQTSGIQFTNAISTINIINTSTRLPTLTSITSYNLQSIIDNYYSIEGLLSPDLEKYTLLNRFGEYPKYTTKIASFLSRFNIFYLQDTIAIPGYFGLVYMINWSITNDHFLLVGYEFGGEHRLNRAAIIKFLEGKLSYVLIYWPYGDYVSINAALTPDGQKVILFNNNRAIEYDLLGNKIWETVLENNNNFLISVFFSSGRIFFFAFNEFPEDKTKADRMIIITDMELNYLSSLTLNLEEIDWVVDINPEGTKELVIPFELNGVQCNLPILDLSNNHLSKCLYSQGAISYFVSGSMDGRYVAINTQYDINVLLLDWETLTFKVIYGKKHLIGWDENKKVFRAIQEEYGGNKIIDIAP